MIDLYLLCMDLKTKHSQCIQNSNTAITKIYSYLRNPSQKTKDITMGWKSDFRYIYGDITTNLSSNSKLNKSKLLGEYGISVRFGEDEIEALQLLFFSIQTYFSLFIKCIMMEILQGIRGENDFSYEEIVLGDFSKKYGITNYCYADWYCWPIFELNNGFGNVLESIYCSVENYRSTATIADFQLNNNYDLIKQIYESIIPKELRHALGEYYTPDWLAESVLKRAISSFETVDVNKLSIVDPTCGSGTFLFKAILLKRKNGGTLSEILTTVHGIDINPLAVLAAKTNYLLSILDLLDGTSPLTIPVYRADIVTIFIPDKVGKEVDFVRAFRPSEVIKNRADQDRAAVQSLKKADIVIGNPPWVNWEYIPNQYKQSSQHLWLDYNLLSAKGRDLSFSKEDISVLITYIAIDKMLKVGGVIGFVIRQGVFKSAQNGMGFRKFKIHDVGIKVIQVEDLSKIKAFDNATNRTALFFARKGEKNVYPVPYYLWEKRKELKKHSFGAYSQLQEVMSQITVTKLYAMPAVKEDLTSLWITADKDSLDSMKKVLGTNHYRARTGVFTGGANAVYWLSILNSGNNFVSVTNIVERAKRKSVKISAELEKIFVFPMLKGSNVCKWKITYDTYLLCPHTAETKMWPVSQKELADIAPKTMQYLQYFRGDLEGRKGFAGWERKIQQKEFHSILRIGDYTFSEYKVVWKYIATEFICAVISSVNDPHLGEKTILPNEKIMYVSTNNEKEAYYLCGVLSSTFVSECVKSYMNPTSISAHVLNKLNIPDFNESNPTHREIASLCKEGHEKSDISPYIIKIDNLMKQIYEV